MVSGSHLVAALLLLALALLVVVVPTARAEPLSIVSFDCGSGVNVTIPDETLTSPWTAGNCWGNVVTGLDAIFDVTYYVRGGATAGSGPTVPTANATIFVLTDLNATNPRVGAVVTTLEIDVPSSTSGPRKPVTAVFDSDGFALDPTAAYFVAFCANAGSGDMTFAWGTILTSNHGFSACTTCAKGTWLYSLATELTFSCTKPSPSPSPSASPSPSSSPSSSPSQKPDSTSSGAQLAGVFRALLRAVLFV